MNELHSSPLPLVDGLIDQAVELIYAAAEAGDTENAKAIFEEWREWIDESAHNVEISCLPPLS